MKIILLLLAMLASANALEFFLRGDSGDYSSDEANVSDPDEVTVVRKLGGSGLDEDDFEKLFVKYKSKEKKCILTYKVKGESKQEIEFDFIDEKDDGSAVTCKQSGVHKTDGIEFPVEAYGFDATWKEPDGDEITKFRKTKWKWTDNERTYVYLEREEKEEPPTKDPMDEDDFKKLYAEYLSKEKKCKLTYRVHGEHKETIYFDTMNESDDGRSVTCKQHVKPTDGIDLPVYADHFDALWTDPDGYKTTEFKETKWKWEVDKDSVLVLKREKKEEPKDPMDEDDFKQLYAEYLSKEKKCKITYRVENEAKQTIYFKHIEESDDGRYVKCKRDYVKPTDGIHLPVYARDFDAVWKESDGDTTREFKKTEWKWEKDKDTFLYLERKKEEPKDPMDEDDFKLIDAEYVSKEKRCKLWYKVKGQRGKESIYFDYIEESDDGRSVTCKKRVNPTDGIHLPVYVDEIDAVWKTTGGDKVKEFKETKWKWEKNKYSVLYLRRDKKDPPKDPMDEDDFKRLVVKYKSKEKRCSLTYKVHGESKETIWFNKMDESDNGRTVVCRDNEPPKSGVWLPVKADGFRAIWKERGGASVEVEESMLRWYKNKDIMVTLKREPNGMDEDDFDKLKVIYNDKYGKCKLIYRVKGEGKEEVWLSDQVRVNKQGDKVVCREYDVKPTDGIDLPVKASDVDAKWFDKKGVSQDVENAEVVWDNGKDIKAIIYLDH